MKYVHINLRQGVQMMYELASTRLKNITCNSSVVRISVLIPQGEIKMVVFLTTGTQKTAHVVSDIINCCEGVSDYYF
jgi:hypothetical protein